MSIIFNDSQKNAVEHFNGPMMVVAGPGSGKTTVITHRIKYLIEHNGVLPNEILVITFTKAAAKEMETRFNRLTGGKYKISFATFHSFFFRIISNHYGYKVNNIISKEEMVQILKSVLKNLNIEEKEEEDFLQHLINDISLVKNDLIDLEHYNSKSIESNDFKSIFRMYEEIKNENNKIDFDDMIIKCYDLLNNYFDVKTNWQKRYKYVLIDEFQDINKVQYECIKMITHKHLNLFIVGDDDQSIYKFRGSRPEFLIRFPEDYKNTKKVILNTNYRSTEQIISICNKVISQNKVRYSKEIIGTNNHGKKPKIIYTKDVTEESLKIAKKIKSLKIQIPYEEIAIIYRTNIQASSFVDAFMDMKIPFQLKDEIPSIYDHQISNDICAYLKLSLDRTLSNELERIINKPKRYISKAIMGYYKNCGKKLLLDLYDCPIMKKWQVLKIEELIFYLNSIKKRNTYDAFKYIRNAVGYDSYLKEYAEYRKISSSGLFEILDELQEISKRYLNLNDYLNHVEDVKKELIYKKTDFNANGVTLSTMHSVKGLEFNTVFIIGAVEGIIPHQKSKSDAELEEELRLFYVGMTRAKKMLYISILKSRYNNETEPTRFLNVLK